MKNSSKVKMSGKKKGFIIGGSVLGVILTIVLVGYLTLNGYLSKVKYASGELDSRVSSIAPEAGDGTGSNSPQDQIDAMNKQVEENMKNSSQPLMYDNDVFNILLIGSDTRSAGGRGRSDSMILISINKKTSKIIETSLLRDIYVGIPGQSEGNRLNAAYAFGGPSLLLQTIQQNFKIKVDKYASVDFYSFMDIVDKVGGVTINISDAEIKVANNYIHELNRLKGLSADDGLLTAAGSQKMTGKQALAFARIRYVGNGDFGRTDRQRMVLDQVFAKIKTLNISQINDLLNILLPQITTNLNKGELFSLALGVPGYSNYKMESWHVPQDGSFAYVHVRGMSVLDVDFSKSIQQMKSKIYE